MANNVALALGDNDTMQPDGVLADAATDVSNGNVNALSDSATTNRRGLYIFLLYVRRVRWTTEKNPNDRSLPRELIWNFSSRKATWLYDLLSKATYSCGTALESHQLL